MSSGDDLADAGMVNSLSPNTKRKRVTLAQLTAIIVADKIVRFCLSHGDLTTNLKLQRLLYYVQAWYLAIYDKPLFEDPLYADSDGPIQPEVFNQFLSFGDGPVRSILPEISVPKRVETHIAEVMEAYDHLNSHDLGRLVCDEEPWKQAQKRMSPESELPEISTEDMKHFYKIRLNG